MAALLLDVGPGDEVIVPRLASPRRLTLLCCGAPVPSHRYKADTLNLTRLNWKAFVIVAPRPIVVVHYAGVGCDMDAILQVGGGHGIAVVEDNAHAYSVGISVTIRHPWLFSYGKAFTKPRTYLLEKAGPVD